MRVVCILFRTPTPLQEIGEILFRLSPQIAIRDKEAIFMEIEQCKKLYSEQSILLRLTSLIRRLKLDATVLVSDDPPSALALSRFRNREKSDLPVSTLEDFACPFKYDELVIKDCEKVIWALDRLGIKTLGDFLKIPSQTLASRFGQLGGLLYRRLQDAKNLPWPKFIPLEKVVERMDWGHELSCDTIDSIFFYIKTLLDRVLLRLFGRGERLLTFQIKFEFEKHSLLKTLERKWRFELNLPHGSTKNILPIVRERICFDLNQKPLEALVNAMELRVIETAPSCLAQRDLFHPKREEEQEAWNNLVTRLTQKLGKEKIFCAKPIESYLPERNWTYHMTEKVLATPKPSIPFPQRPMRLFKKPVQIQFTGESITIGPQLSKVIQYWGPEVLSGESWEKPFERIYYRVLADTLEHFWIFQEEGVFYAHGVFD